MSVFLQCDLQLPESFKEEYPLNDDSFIKTINEIFHLKIIQSLTLIGEPSEIFLEFRAEFKMYKTEENSESMKSKTKFSKEFNLVLSDLISKVKIAKKEITGIEINFKKNTVKGDINFKVFYANKI
jgi:hypothetical protein